MLSQRSPDLSGLEVRHSVFAFLRAANPLDQIVDERQPAADMSSKFFGSIRGNQPLFLTLARKPDLDQETAFTICRLIDHVGPSLKDDWDWDWLDGESLDYRALIEISLLKKAWKVLATKDWLSLQTISDEDKRICTISPLAELVELKSLVLQNNLIQDLAPVSRMLGLRYLNCHENKISDLTPLRNLRLLEELSLANNPVTSLRVLEDLPNLRELNLSTDQVQCFVECKSLPAIRSLDITGEEAIENLMQWPDMPSLKVLDAHKVQRLDGIERFGSLETLKFYEGEFSDLKPLSGLKRLTHLTICSSKQLDAAPLSGLHALRRLSINCPKVRNITALTSLPVLHQVRMDDEATCDATELSALRKDLTSWDEEFKNIHKGRTPSLALEIVDQQTFDYYDSKAPYGMVPDDFNDGMLESEREWLLRQIRESLSVFLEDDTDFHLPYTSGRRRSERVILYSAKAYESFREIALAIQRILCETRNDWLIWAQALPAKARTQMKVWRILLSGFIPINCRDQGTSQNRSEFDRMESRRIEAQINFGTRTHIRQPQRNDETRHSSLACFGFAVSHPGAASAPHSVRLRLAP
jgi:hypothetical protein